MNRSFHCVEMSPAASFDGSKGKSDVICACERASESTFSFFFGRLNRVYVYEGMQLKEKDELLHLLGCHFLGYIW